MGANYLNKGMLKLCPLLILSLAISLSANSAERPDFKFVKFPAWVLAYQSAALNGVIIEEYTPYGQSVHDWHEMFTWQYFPEWPNQSSPREIMDGLKRFRMSRNPKTEWKIITQTYDSIVYEWSVRDESVIGEYSEIARIAVGADGIHIFRYARKSASISLHERREWARKLKKIGLNSK